MKKIIIPLMIAATLAGCGDNQKNNNAEFTAQQKEEIGKTASQYLVKHPETLIKASESLKKQQMEAFSQSTIKAAIAHKGQLINNPDTPFIGKKDAKVNVIEFFDYQCVFCARIAPAIVKLEKANPDVKFIFKETPIFASRWKSSKYAADMGNWIYKSEGSSGYAKYHNALFATGKNEGRLTKADVDRVAKSAGANLSKFNANGTFINNFQLFEALGFRGTPALIVMPSKNADASNVKVINGYDPTALTAAIQSVKVSVAK